MEDALSIIGSICSIISLIITIVVANYVYQLNKTISNSEHDTRNKVKVESSEIGGDFTGRDKNSN